MFEIDKLLSIKPYSLNRFKKKEIYVDAMRYLTRYHYDKCKEYSNILDLLNFKGISDLQDVPFFPVRLYKKMDLKSVSLKDVSKVLTSSGTTNQNVSKIFLDKITSINQTKALVKIVSSFIGDKRLPMLVIDCPSVIKDRNSYSARGAAIMGFSMFGYNTVYALTDQMELDESVVSGFVEKYCNESVLIFGFTYMVWQQFLQRINCKLNIPNGILIHGGGWKKLLDIAVDNNTFKKKAMEFCLIDKVYNYYGMVEQTGSIFMECECGYLHSSIFSDILIRNTKDFSVCDFEEQGVVQLLSLLPMSYPGHSVLSEDVGILHGEDDCKCGRLGKYFSIQGRLKDAEIRGCSNVLYH